MWWSRTKVLVAGTAAEDAPKRKFTHFVTSRYWSLLVVAGGSLWWEKKGEEVEIRAHFV